MDQKDSPEDKRTAEDADADAPQPDAPLNRAERRHGTGLNHPYNPAMPGRRGGFNAPFQKGGPENKRTKGHRKTG